MQALSPVRPFFIISFILLTMNFAASATVSAAETVDRIVAIVNEDIIRLKELNEAFEPLAEQVYAKDYAESKEQEILYEKRMEVLNQLIDEALADQVIQEKDITVSSQEIDNAIEQIKSMNHSTDEQLQQYLNMNGMDMAAYREKIRQQILRSKLVDREVKSSIVITESDIREYYENHPEKYKGKPAYHLKNIFVSYEGDKSGSAPAPGREKISDAMAAINEGQAFEEVARTYSEASNASDGGDLGNFALSDLQTDLQPVIKDLEPGQASPVVETERGFQIFYLADIVHPGDKPFEEVAGEIRNLLYEQAVDRKFNEWLDSLRAESDIKIIR
ncbi:MAG: SurA N-terminal domain-containing protein [Desulfobacterales bacterium]